MPRQASRIRNTPCSHPATTAQHVDKKTNQCSPRCGGRNDSRHGCLPSIVGPGGRLPRPVAPRLPRLPIHPSRDRLGRWQWSRTRPRWVYWSRDVVGGRVWWGICFAFGGFDFGGNPVGCHPRWSGLLVDCQKLHGGSTQFWFGVRTIQIGRNSL